MPSFRELILYVLVASLLALFWTWNAPEGPTKVLVAVKGGIHAVTTADSGHHRGLPDFSRYQQTRTLDRSEFPLEDPKRRLIIVGDIHGMVSPFSKLLATLQYHSDVDTLIHTGDFLAKGKHEDSMKVLSFMTRHNITGVRGNHDQQVLEWRGWINWICSSRDGCRWLERVERDWHNRRKRDKSLTLDDFIEHEKKALSFHDKHWWKAVPKDWKLLGDHYRIARDMSDDEHRYLLQLPLRLYIPSAHAYVVHAGLLPSDPRYPFFDAKRQPLARLPMLGKHDKDLGFSQENVERMRNVQEREILDKVPPNGNPWVVLNMRTLVGKEVSRKSDGKHWYNVWDDEVTRCAGFERSLLGIDNASITKDKHPLPCYPASVVYGHMASMGLNIRRWTFGLDSGCVYGRQLSALVIGGPRTDVDKVNNDDGQWEDLDFSDADDEDDQDSSGKHKPENGDVFPFGDRYKGAIIAVDC